jgi:preprotein translocase subunit SecD
MLNFSKLKLLLVLIPCIWAICSSVPHLNYSRVETFNDAQQALESGVELTASLSNDLQKWPNWLPSKIINLGLDLRGGAHLLVEVSLEDVYNERLDFIWNDVRTKLREMRDDIGSIRRTDTDIGSLKINIEKVEYIGKAVSVIKKLSQPVASLTSLNATTFIVSSSGNNLVIQLSPEEKKILNDRTMAQSLEIIRRRVDEAGTREPSIQRQGERRILVQVPGIGSAEELLQLIGKTAKLTFNAVEARSSDKEKAVGFGRMVLPDAARSDLFYILDSKDVVSGSDLTNAQAAFDQNNRPAVSFQFNPSGGRKFGAYTRNNIGSPFAIVLDGEVISAPVIQSHIPGGSGIITGNFSVEESNRLAILLRAGALPAEINVLEQRTIGPELGSDSIKAGRIAAVVGGILVFIFMFVSYGLFGIFANIALIINIALLFSIMALIGATLTLPGIAGIVLTLGMAVDANVLVFERIREELRLKRGPIRSIELGYEKALTSIIDANVTTMIAAIILFVLGSGPVRGFSITLGVGIVTSVFSAIYVTRLFIAVYCARVRPKTLEI